MVLREIAPTEVNFAGSGNDLVRSFPADTVVLAGYHQPNCELADHLPTGAFGLHLVGDAAGTSSIQAAIHGAAAVARVIY